MNMLAAVTKRVGMLALHGVQQHFNRHADVAATMKDFRTSQP